MPPSLIDWLVNPNDCKAAHLMCLSGDVPMFGLALVSLDFAKFFQSELPTVQALIGDERVLAWKNPSSPQILVHRVSRTPAWKWHAQSFSEGLSKDICEADKKQIFDKFQEELRNECGVLMNSFGVVFKCSPKENGLATKIFNALGTKITATLESIECVVQQMSKVYAKPLKKGEGMFIWEIFKISPGMHTIIVADATDDFVNQFGRLGSLFYKRQAIANLCCIKDGEKLQYRADRCVPKDWLFEEFKQEDGIANYLATIHDLQKYVPQTSYDRKTHKSKVEGIKSLLALHINALVDDPSFMDRTLKRFAERFEQLAAFAFLWKPILSKIDQLPGMHKLGNQVIHNLGTWLRNQFASPARTIDDRMLENLICWVMLYASKLSDVSKLHATLKDLRFSEFEEFAKSQQRGKKRPRE
jgi:hypothetical protein